MDEVLNPHSSKLDVQEICIVHSVQPLKELCSKYRPEFRQLNHPFRETLKTLTKVCNRKKKVNVTKAKTLQEFDKNSSQHGTACLSFFVGVNVGPRDKFLNINIIRLLNEKVYIPKSRMEQNESVFTADSNELFRGADL